MISLKLAFASSSLQQLCITSTLHYVSKHEANSELCSKSRQDPPIK